MKIKQFLLKYWPLFLILFIGGSLRLYGLLLNPISLYSDEVDIGYQVYSLLSTGKDYQGNLLPLQFHSFSDVRTSLPIYFTALFNLLGLPLDYAIRFTPALFGILGILGTYLFMENLSWKIFKLKLAHTGTISAALLSLIPWHLTYSRIGFELSCLYFFTIFGLYFFTEYLVNKKNGFLLYLSAVFLGLTPMVYSTAKMSVIAYPLVLFLIAYSHKVSLNVKQVSIFLVLLFLPLSLVILNGGAASRFSYISIFTDPTTKTEIDYQRLVDSGPLASVGSSPTLETKLLHNRPLFYAGRFINNVLGLLSTDYLFIKGDPNLRHSPANSGMLFRTIFPILLIGLYYLIRNRHDKLLALLILLTLIPIATSAITRDGATHASRSFMLILPAVLVSGVGLAYLFDFKKILLYLFLGLISLESIFFVHDYWVHYRYGSEKVWSAGMKELIQLASRYPDRPVVISPKNEHPLIFYLYYTRFDPRRFQQFSKSESVYKSTEGENDLDGNRIGDSNLYIASLTDYGNKPANPLPNAVYFLTRSEVELTNIRSFSTTGDIIKLPSGDPLYYEIHF